METLSDKSALPHTSEQPRRGTRCILWKVLRLGSCKTASQRKARRDISSAEKSRCRPFSGSEMNHSASFGVILSRKWVVLILEHLLDMLVLFRLEQLAVSVRDPARLDMALVLEVSEFLFDEFLLLFATCKRLTGQGDLHL